MDNNFELLKILWKQFADIPINDDDKIEKEFTVFDYVYPIGTCKLEIWHYFDEKCPNNLHDDLMFSN